MYSVHCTMYIIIENTINVQCTLYKVHYYRKYNTCIIQSGVLCTSVRTKLYIKYPRKQINIKLQCKRNILKHCIKYLISGCNDFRKRTLSKYHVLNLCKYHVLYLSTMHSIQVTHSTYLILINIH